MPTLKFDIGEAFTDYTHTLLQKGSRTTWRWTWAYYFNVFHEYTLPIVVIPLWRCPCWQGADCPPEGFRECPEPYPEKLPLLIINIILINTLINVLDKIIIQDGLNMLIIHALRPYFLRGKFRFCFWILTICLVFWWVVNLLLTARVNLFLRKMGRLTDPLWMFPPRLVLSFLLRMVRFLAMFFLTVLILANLVALPDVALEFLRVRSSSFNFSRLALIVSISLYLILWQTFFSTIDYH